MTRHPLREHLRGRTILLTGVTGFLGKVIVERLLCVAPEVERIYVLIRSGRLTAAERFESEVLPSGLFDSLAGTYGEAWLPLARSAVVPVAGDVSVPRLGLDPHTHAQLTGSVDIIINGAASVTFDAPLDEAMRHNVQSVGHVADFARACRAAVLVHVSTAFVAGRQTGRIAEAPLAPDIAATEAAAVQAIVEGIYDDAARGNGDVRETRARLIEAGMSRARSLGWHDSYSYTKALGEMTLAQRRGAVPTAIVRPSIIESSLRDPVPGWLQNLNVGDPLFVEYGRGRMPDFPLGLETVFDVVPVDLVANAIVALLPHAGACQEHIGYWAIGSGSLNPLTGGRLYELANDYFSREPMLDRRGQPIPLPTWTFPSPEQFRARYQAEASRSTKVKRLMYLADLYESYLNVGCVFDTTNTERLLGELHDADRVALDFDIRRVEWRSYIQDIHLPGLRRHVLREHTRGRAEVNGV